VPKDLDHIIVELEALTARMLAKTCWEQSSEFGELSKSRCALAATLMNRRDLDSCAVERIRAVIQAGEGLLAQTLAMRESVTNALAETERQELFARELRSTVLRHASVHHVDMKA